MKQKVYYISDWDVAPGYYTYERHRYPQAYIELGPWHILNFKDIKFIFLYSWFLIKYFIIYPPKK